MEPGNGSGDPAGRVHFVGIAGTGMSALAQHRALAGGRVSGSDRAFDRGQLVEIRQRLSGLGIAIAPQDGQAVADAEAVVTSTAVEAEIPDLAAAREAGIPIVHRAERLARLLHAPGSVGIAGTSGKSTVTALVFEILRHAGRDPGLITGGPLVSLRSERLLGNAWAGSGPLVAEVDESDRSLRHHAPDCGVILNLHRDHLPEDEVLALFEDFAGHVRGELAVADDPALAGLRSRASRVFGFGADADFRGEDLQLEPWSSRFRLRDQEVRVPFAGAHNAVNALAALAVTDSLGVPLDVAKEALAEARGVIRRFQVVGRRGGVVVIDDYAHNPAKITAAIRAAQRAAPRVHAFFQPHGYGPTRFLWDGLLDAFATARPRDEVWLGEIYYAGGTVIRDVSSRDLVAALEPRGVRAHYLERRSTFAGHLASRLAPGDAILVMGARDPSLDRFGLEVLEQLPESGAPAAARAP